MVFGTIGFVVIVVGSLEEQRVYLREGRGAGASDASDTLPRDLQLIPPI